MRGRQDRIQLIERRIAFVLRRLRSQRREPGRRARTQRRDYAQAEALAWTT